MIEVPLTQGKVALIDDEDEWIAQWRWHCSSYRYGWRAIRCIEISGKRKTIYMHRVIMNAPDDLQVDHINHNGLDNRKSNLRLVTNTQNQMNSRKKTGCSSKYKGVSWYRRDMKWEAYIRINGNHKYLGNFNSEREAAMAYNLAAQEHFGEYSLLNEL